MSTDLYTEPTMNQLSEAASESARRAADTARETANRANAIAKNVTGAVEEVAGDVTDATHDVARSATDTVKEMYHSATLKTGDTLATSKEYVRRNPVPVVLGAVVFGVAIGYALMVARRKPTFGERHADEPLLAVREAILGALSPVTQRVQKGYDSALDGAGKVMDRVHNFGPVHTVDSFSDRIGRIGNNLKFW